MKEQAIEFGDKCVMIYADDKAKILIGKLGLAISTGVCGSIANNDLR